MSKYTGYISTGILVPDKNDRGSLNWQTDNYDIKKVCEDATLKDCLDKLFKETEGSRWIFYPSCYIEDDEGFEVWQSTAIEYSCNCCKHIEYDRIQDKYPEGDK